MFAKPIPQQIEQWPTERLVEYQRNPRKNGAAVDRMCGSIREFDFKIPVLARSDGEIVDGHLRVKAARDLMGTLRENGVVCGSDLPRIQRSNT